MEDHELYFGAVVREGCMVEEALGEWVGGPCEKISGMVMSSGGPRWLVSRARVGGVELKDRQ